MVIRVTVANITPERLAEIGQQAGLAGTVFASTGFGSWGIEPGATVEIATEDETRLYLLEAELFGATKEEAIYVTINGGAGRRLRTGLRLGLPGAFLTWRDGKHEVLSC